MKQFPELLCPKCGETYTISEQDLKDAITRFRMDRMYECAQQMADKKGPFYDRWVAAMALRPPPKRCKTCRFYEQVSYGGRFLGISCKDTGRSGGCFACKQHRDLHD